ncbi:GTPase ERA-like, chloroplastic [Silene latifolia]|uniref:GTPase ERA-like, chloroplastic n=1 Tax=Silene latifolia TaxID=37657 RepID=UPI003D783335
MAAITAQIPPFKLERKIIHHYHNLFFTCLSPLPPQNSSHLSSSAAAYIKFTARSNRLQHRSAVVVEEESETEYEYEDDEDEDEGGSEFIHHSSSYGEAGHDEAELTAAAAAGFLSLSEKPDRNIALLDEYEMEENGFDPNSNHRSGYVAVVGKPNVGKSTLSNQMIGQKLSIVTDKPQTTRHRILGICSGPEYQMVLYDTPGVIEKKMHKLDTMMMKNVRSAATNADCMVVVVDACKPPENLDEVFNEGVGELKDKIPTLLVLNKKDLIKPGEIAKKLQWYEKFTDVDEVIPVSAKYGHGVDDVKDWILSKLPLGPPYYPKDIASEHPERFFIAEIVREKIFLQYKNEIPYVCQVNVVSYKTRAAAKDFIQVEIVVEKNSQKIILIGKEGKALKLLATAARLDIEDFLQKKVFLEVEVKVKENWRQDEGLLKHYGYGGKIKVI